MRFLPSRPRSRKPVAAQPPGRAPDGVVLELQLREMVAAAPSVIGYHQGQLNLLQVVWGDTTANIPPNWGKEEI